MRFERTDPVPAPRDVRITLTATEARRVLALAHKVCATSNPLRGTPEADTAFLLHQQLQRILGIDQ